MSATHTKPTTREERFALRPRHNLDRWLFRGELREEKVTQRNPKHGLALWAPDQAMRARNPASGVAGPPPLAFENSLELAGDPDLPGIRCPVHDCFE